MGYLDIRFPLSQQYTTRLGPRHYTAIHTVDSGAVHRIANRDPQIVFDVHLENRTAASLADLIDFVRGTEGSLHSFKIRDLTDWTTAPDHVSPPDADIAPSLQLVGTGDGSEGSFQLQKHYNAGEDYQTTRNVTKPDTSLALQVYVNSVLVSASTYAINTTTGILTFNPGSIPPMGHAVEWLGSFDIVAMFGKETDDWLGATADNYDAYSLPSIPILGVPEHLEKVEHYDYGMATNLGDIGGTTVALTAYDPRHITAYPATAASLLLPALADVHPGGPVFRIRNSTGAGTLSVKDSDSVLVKDLTAGQSSAFWVGWTDATQAVKEWVVVN